MTPREEPPNFRKGVLYAMALSAIAWTILWFLALAAVRLFQ